MIPWKAPTIEPICVLLMMVIMARMIFIIITIIIVMMVIVTKSCFHPSRCQDLSATWYTSAGPPPPILQRSISPIFILILGSMIDAIFSQYLCFDLFRKTDSGGILSRLASNMIDHVRILRDGMWLIFPIHHFHLLPNHPCGNVFTKCVKEGLINSSFTVFNISGHQRMRRKLSVVEMFNRCFSNKCFRDGVRKVNIAQGTSPSMMRRMMASCPIRSPLEGN